MEESYIEKFKQISSSDKNSTGDVTLIKCPLDGEDWTVVVGSELESWDAVKKPI